MKIRRRFGRRFDNPPIGNEPPPSPAFSKEDVGLSRVDDTPDMEKPLSEPQAQALGEKVSVHGGDVSATVAAAPGTHVKRTLAERLAETASVTDLEGDPTGRKDASPAFAEAAGLARARGVLMAVPAGLWRLTEAFQIPKNVGLRMEGVRFRGKGFIDGIGDWAPFLNRLITGAWFQRTNMAGAEYTTVSAIEVSGTGAAGSYRKGAGYDVAVQNDPSSYPSTGKPKNREVIGRQSTAIIGFGNKEGRAIGLGGHSAALEGSEGYQVGVEGSVQPATHQPWVRQYNSKYAFLARSFGSYGGTAAYYVDPDSRFHSGFSVHAESVEGYAFELFEEGSTDKRAFAVDRDGNLWVRSIKTNGPLQFQDPVAFLKGLFATEGVFTGEYIIIEQAKSVFPETSKSPGKKGMICWDKWHLYVCIEDNDWRRIGLGIEF